MSLRQQHLRATWLAVIVGGHFMAGTGIAPMRAYCRYLFNDKVPRLTREPR